MSDDALLEKYMRRTVLAGAIAYLTSHTGRVGVLIGLQLQLVHTSPT